MHTSVQEWVNQRVDGCEPFGTVIELGSLDVNGNVRHLVPHDRWTGIDLVRGAGVDIVCDVHDLPLPDHTADLVLCLEMLEHDSDPNATMATVARLLAREGRALVTTRSEGFPHHHPPDLWRFTGDDIRALAYTAGLDVVHIQPDPLPTHPGVFAELHGGT